MKLTEVRIDTPRPPRDGNGGGEPWRDGWGASPAPPIANVKLAAMLVCAASVMLFVGLSGGYIVLRHVGVKWPPAGFPPLPASLWLNTIVILVSSATLLFSQNALKQSNRDALKWGLVFTFLFGAMFLLRQWMVWTELMGAGVRMNSGIYGSVFFCLTLVHAAHVIGGLAFVGYVTALAWRRNDLPPAARAKIEACAIYWHFVGALWVYLFGILYLI